MQQHGGGMNHPSETRCWGSSGTVFALGRQGSCPAEMPPAYQGDTWAGEGQGCSLRAARHGAKTTGGNRGTGGKTNGAERLIQTAAAPRGRAAARKKPHGQLQPRVRGTGWRGAARRGTGRGGRLVLRAPVAFFQPGSLSVTSSHLTASRRKRCWGEPGGPARPV